MDHKKGTATESTQRDRSMLLSGVLVLTIANILVKAFGLIYKVPLNAKLGDEMINVNAAASIYSVLYMISTAGVPVAVSVLVSECRAKGDVRRLKRVFRVSLITLLVVGAVGTGVMWLLARPISQINSGGDSFRCLCTIAPCLFFISICCVYRGYCQGFQQMTPTAVSEMLESFGKMAIGFLIIYVSLDVYGQDTGTAAALSELGTVAGIVMGMIYLIFAKRRYERRNKLQMFGNAVANEQVTDQRPILPRLISIAVPISLSAVVLNLAALVDSQLMRPLLTDYYGDELLAKQICSDYTTGAVTLYNLPTILIYPISCSIVPFISAARVSGDRGSVRRVTNSALRIASIIGLPCAFGMSVLSGPILSLVFGAGDSAMAVNAGPLLRVLAISVFLVSMLSVTNALLQAHHQERKPMISMLVGLGVKVVADLVLTTKFGAIGAPVSTVLFHITVVSMNFYFVIRCTDVMPSFGKVFIRPFFAALCSAAGALGVYVLTAPAWGGNTATLLAMAAAAAVYLIAVCLFRCITSEDVLLLPIGKRLQQILSRMHLIR